MARAWVWLTLFYAFSGMQGVSTDMCWPLPLTGRVLVKGITYRLDPPSPMSFCQAVVWLALKQVNYGSWSETTSEEVTNRVLFELEVSWPTFRARSKVDHPVEVEHSQRVACWYFARGNIPQCLWISPTPKDITCKVPVACIVVLPEFMTDVLHVTTHALKPRRIGRILYIYKYELKWSIALLSLCFLALGGNNAFKLTNYTNYRNLKDFGPQKPQEQSAE